MWDMDFWSNGSANDQAILFFAGAGAVIALVFGIVHITGAKKRHKEAMAGEEGRHERTELREATEEARRIKVDVHPRIRNDGFKLEATLNGPLRVDDVVVKATPLLQWAWEPEDDGPATGRP